MKSTLYLFLLIFFTISSANAQNLVLNPGFEDYKKLPCNLRRVNYLIEDYLQGWYSPTFGTPDIWISDRTKVCSSSTYSNGLPEARTGNFIVGMLNYLPYGGKIVREYMQISLKEKLRVGRIYHAEMYVFVDPFSSIRTNNLGMHFSTKPLRDSASYQLLAKPQINSQVVLKDTLRWQKVSGCFRADSSFSYLTIGNFIDDAHTRIERIIKPGYNAIEAYYLLDDILVSEAQTDELITAFDLGQDSTLCTEQTLKLLIPGQSGVRYRWQDGRVTSSYTVSQSGLYSVTATAGLCSVTDSIRVTIEPPVHLPADTVLCQGETLTLTPNYPAKRALLWSDGSQDSTLTVSQAGTYSVRVPSAFCPIADTIRVEYADCPVRCPTSSPPTETVRTMPLSFPTSSRVPGGWRSIIGGASGCIMPCPTPTTGGPRMYRRGCTITGCLTTTSNAPSKAGSR